MMISVNMIYSN